MDRRVEVVFIGSQHECLEDEEDITCHCKKPW